MNTWVFAGLLSVAGAPPAPAASVPPPPAKVREAVKRSIEFLEMEGVEWKEKRKCASCHHAPMMIWALGEAKNRGFAVDDKALTTIRSWTLETGDPAKVFPPPPKDAKAPPPPGVSQGPLTLALGLEALPSVDGRTRDGLKRIAALLVSQQSADGSWSLPAGGRPPLADSAEVMTTWTTLALSRADKQGEDISKANREKALKWLSNTTPGDSHQALVLRLLLQHRLGKPAPELQATAKLLLGRQNADGGWSQTKEMASDAYAAGQTLYALGLAGLTPADLAVARGQAFLVRTQHTDGSWVMTSRPNKPGDKGSKNTGPITYVGTAWGTLGLAVTAPPAAKE